MRIEIHYFADDETEFYTKEECEEYERTKSDLFSAVTFFNENMEMIEVDYECIESYAMFAVIHEAEKADRLFEHLREMISFGDVVDFIHDGDVFYYNPDDGDWHDMEIKGKKILSDAQAMRTEADKNRDDL